MLSYNGSPEIREFYKDFILWSYHNLKQMQFDMAM